jgi:threonine synthase
VTTEPAAGSATAAGPAMAAEPSAATEPAADIPDDAGAGPAIKVVCAGCGREAGRDEPFPIVCAARTPGDDIDHLMLRRLDPGAVRWPSGADPSPFVRYRTLFRAWHVARAAGWPDERYVDLVRELDDAIGTVDGHGFRTTPFARADGLSDRLGFLPAGGAWVKDETGNVSGSHKARHLMGVMLELLVEERTGRLDTARRPLAIASCGNAALAAAVVARAAGRRLDVFVPTSADPVVLDWLEGLGAKVQVCPRIDGEAGDPSVLRLREALAAGAIPFTCQGDENGLAIEGGQTLGWEMADARAAAGQRIDRVVVQVGGGALASGVAAGLAEAAALGILETVPRLDTVQTSGGWPLRRAYERVVERLTAAGVRVGPGRPLDLEAQAVSDALADVARHRSDYMWPWETEPVSIAHGILDDETYDWLAVVRAMLATGGTPVVVDEATLAEAEALGRDATGIDADATGTAGLAGLLDLLRQGDVRPDETVAILFTGARRVARPGNATSHPLDRSTR